MDKQTWKVVQQDNQEENNRLIESGEYEYRCSIPAKINANDMVNVYFNNKKDLYSALASVVDLRKDSIVSVKDLRAKKNIYSGVYVYDHDYVNTGGNCMVSVFKLWYPKENVTRFLLANESGCSINTADYVTAGIEFDENMVLLTADSGYFDPDLDTYDLLRYCWFEFIKAEHNYFGTITDVFAGMLEAGHYNDKELMSSIRLVDREGNDDDCFWYFY